MPRGDGSGPAGMGPMTGRAAGFCAGFGVPGFSNQVPGRGFGLGFGRGLGMGFRGGRGGRWGMPYGLNAGVAQPLYQPTALSGEQERESLQMQARQMEAALENINQRISDLESAKTKK